MAQLKRQTEMVTLIEQQKYVSIEQLTARFDVTPQTLRRDLNALAERGLIRRVHGGAGAVESSTVNTAYTTRKTQHYNEKKAIAEALAACIPDRSSLFINIGTSTELVAEALLNHQGLEVITNNLNVADALLQQVCNPPEHADQHNQVRNSGTWPS